jgi:glycosyltransferase involved in cell wall biosynthesis
MSSISVCMSIYGFCEYLPAQLESIVRQTILIDELVVVEDFSELDSPHEYLGAICEEHGIRLKYIKLKTNVDPAEGFRQAICASSGDIIYLCDHDDIWNNDRVEKAIPYHQHSVLVVSNGKSFVQETCEEKTLYSELNNNFFKALTRNKLIGATLSIQGDYARNLARKFSFYPMHDWVIYLASIILKKKITLTKEELLLYRRHSNTYTGRSKNNLYTRIRFRVSLLLKSLVIYLSSRRFRVK